MTGPMPSLVPGNMSMTASARTCAAEWRIGPSSPPAPWSISSAAEPRSGASRPISIASSIAASTAAPSFSWPITDLLRESRNPSSIDRTRGSALAVPPAFATVRWRTRGRAIGRLPGRFAGRSRVVPMRRRLVGLPAWARLSGDPLRAARPARRSSGSGSRPDGKHTTVCGVGLRSSPRRRRAWCCPG